MEALQEISEYLIEQGKNEWALCLQAVIAEFGSSSDSDVDYSEEEGGAIPEGVPEVNIDPNGFHSIV